MASPTGEDQTAVGHGTPSLRPQLARLHLVRERVVADPGGLTEAGPRDLSQVAPTQDLGGQLVASLPFFEELRPDWRGLLAAPPRNFNWYVLASIIMPVY
jgi:hypothetical protein